MTLVSAGLPEKYPKAFACLRRGEQSLFCSYAVPANHWMHLRRATRSTRRTRLCGRTKRTKRCGSRTPTLTTV